MNQPKQIWKHSKLFRCRPVLNESVVIGKSLIDLDGTVLLFYKLDDFSIQETIEVLSKKDQYCGKLKILNDNYVVVYGMQSFAIVDITKKTVETEMSLDFMIECVEAKNSHLVITTSDEDGENKLVYCWKISKEGKIQKKYEPIEIGLPDYEECSDENLQLAFITSYQGNPRIYIYWKNTNQMIEIDPLRKNQEKYSRVKKISFVTDLNVETYAEICMNKITIHSKKGGKEMGILTNEGEDFKKLSYKEGETSDFYSISNKGIKKWKFQTNSQPVVYVESNNYEIQNIYFGENDQLIGINTEKKFVIVWKNSSECTISNFPNEIIRKILKINETQVCLLLEATASKEIENEHKVQKYNKMQIYDFEKDVDVAKKAVLKFQYKIDVDSSIADHQNTIRFILNEEAENDVKKYIFRWSPFCEQKKKDVKKREIAGGKDFDEIKLYPFDRIVTFKKAKETEMMYDVFGKSTASKSQVSFFDFNAKKIGEYELSSDVSHVEMSELNQLYAVGHEKLSIYKIDSNSKGRLEKIHELEFSVSLVYPFGQYLLMKKGSSILIYDNDFDLLMKEDCEEQVEQLRVLKINESSFILADGQEFTKWDLKKEDREKLRMEGCEPNLCELMGESHILVVGKWIKAYDFQALQS